MSDRAPCELLRCPGGRCGHCRMVAAEAVVSAVRAGDWPCDDRAGVECDHPHAPMCAPCALVEALRVYNERVGRA